MAPPHHRRRPRGSARAGSPTPSAASAAQWHRAGVPGGDGQGLRSGLRQANVQAPDELAGAQQAGVAGQSERVAVTASHPGLHPTVFNQEFSVNSSPNPAPAGGAVVLNATIRGVNSLPRVTSARSASVLPERAALLARHGRGDAAQRTDSRGVSARRRPYGGAPGRGGRSPAGRQAPPPIGADAKWFTDNSTPVYFRAKPEQAHAGIEGDERCRFNACTKT